ncbi:MAG: histidine phosphotransferase family protein [Caulobacteraceae bacterium]|nr:histidine phosphotransferase family protein [Caulobacteraceae bacterium]
MTDPDPTPAAPDETTAPAVQPAPVTPVELAAHLAGRMCHDFISPAGAIVSGLDLLEDPNAQDMRDDALALIADSARKLVALLSFDRVAFGASAAAEAFDPRELQALTAGIFAHQRAELDWSVEAASLAKPVSRILLNLAQICGGALPMGGTAHVGVTETDEASLVVARAAGGRVRLRPEVMDGLNGERLGEGLGGHWVQAFYLRGLVDAVGGTLEVEVGEGEVTLRASVPREP